MIVTGSSIMGLLRSHWEVMLLTLLKGTTTGQGSCIRQVGSTAVVSA